MKKNIINYRSLIKELFVWTLTIVILIPFAIVIINSFKTSAESGAFNLTLPKELRWENYRKVIQEGKLYRAFINSLILSIIPSTIATITSAMGAFVIIRNKTKFNNTMYFFFFLGLIAPINYVPTVKVLQSLKLFNTYAGAVLLIAATGIPFSVFLFCRFISSVPRNLDEAAIIDGCNGFSLFFRVILPILKPVTITSFVLIFLGGWNDFLTPLYVLNTSKKWGMVLAIYNFFGQYERDWNLVCAVIVLSILPIMIVYAFVQKYIISGMTSGAIKG